MASTQTELLAFIKENSFCTLITSGKNKLFTSHVNLIQDKDNLFFGHLAAKNHQAKQLQNGTKILAIFKKSRAQQDEISTVHLHGTVKIIHEEEVKACMLSRLTSKYESGRCPQWAINWDIYCINPNW